MARPEAGPIEKFGEYISDHVSAIESSRPPYLITMNMASRLSLLRSIGLFDERWIRMEDCDIAYRILKAGASIVYEPEAVVYHHHRDSLATLAWQGYLHGYYTPAFRRFHRQFIEDYRRGQTSMSATVSSGPLRARQQIGWWRTQICWCVFRSAKTVGMWAGRRFPPAVE